MDLCINCRKKPIENKKRRLCIPCYCRLLRKGFIRIIPKTESERRVDLICSLIRKYGREIIKDIDAVNSKQFWNLTDVAQKYKLSRERVRQYYKLIFGRGYREIQNKKSEERNKDIACVHDPRRKVADYKPDSHIFRVAEAEKLFLEECQKRKIDYKIPCSQEIDIKVNGYNIDVKTCFSARLYSPSAITKHFKYAIKGIQTKIADFFACYHPIEKEFFIIPRTATRIAKDGVISIYILEQPSNYHSAKNYYWEYRDAWHLLNN